KIPLLLVKGEVAVDPLDVVAFGLLLWRQFLDRRRRLLGNRGAGLCGKHGRRSISLVNQPHRLRLNALLLRRKFVLGESRLIENPSFRTLGIVLSEQRAGEQDEAQT